MKQYFIYTNSYLLFFSRTLSSHILRARCIKTNLENKIELYELNQENSELLHYMKLYSVRITKVLETLESVENIIETNNELKPYKILGLTAQNGLTISIITFVVSFFSILLSLFTAVSVSAFV